MSRARALVNFGVILGTLCLRVPHAWSAPAASLHEPARGPEAEKPVDASARAQGFVVQPFQNTQKVGALKHLEAGLPALVADRFWNLSPLRFVGPRTLLAAVAPRAEAAVPRDHVVWIVSGRFETRPGMRLAVTVTVSSAAPEAGGPSTSHTLEGTRQEAPTLALQAALVALRALPGLQFVADPPEASRPFARDPYAFVLYARGISSHLGLGGVPRSATNALNWLGRSLVIDPRVPETRRFMALLHAEAGRPGHARTLYTLALDERPDYVPALAALAFLDKDSAAAEALLRLERLLLLDPGAWQARRLYGEMLYEAGKMAEARAALEKVLAHKPDDAQARRILTLVLSSQRAGADLVREFETIVKLDPASVPARLDLAAAYLNEGRVADASRTYDEVLERQPKHREALKIAADLFRQQGQMDEAAKRYERLRRLAPQDPRPVFLLGALYHEGGNLVAAERLFTEAAQFPQVRAEAWSNLGAVMIDQGRAREARWFLMKAAQLRPNKASIRYNYAVGLRALEQHADALNELRAAALADPQDAQIRFAAGVVSLRLGLLREAEQDFQAALAIDPVHAGAQHNLKLLAKVTGRRDEALKPGLPTVN